jgi:hypothetical protein
MSENPSSIILADAQKLDGTEHVVISQSGTLRRCLLTDVWKPATLILPTADPHVVGALWNNAGTITISAG